MRFVITIVAMITSLVACGCQKNAEPAGKTNPANVDHHVEEQQLNTITLTDRAEQRLGIALADVRVANVKRKRQFGGEVVIPPGQTIIVSSPIAGTLSGPADAPVPAPGANLAAGQVVFNFKPLLTPERDVLTPAERVRVAQTKADIATALIEAERQVEAAKIQVESARLEHGRTVDLLNLKAGSQRTVELAEAALKLAREAQSAAEARHSFLAAINLDEEVGELVNRPIKSPVDGILQSIDAAVGETVGVGEPLFHVVKLDRVWIRVPVYVGNWRELDTSAGASVSEYGQPPAAPTRPAVFAAAPPSANAAATTVDVFFEIENTDGRLYPGQKLAVTIPLRTTQESLVVPFNAILYDVLGGEWVYEQTGQRTYARRRVAVRYVDGAQAVLKSGPSAGAKVVTDGAELLFGTEFGVGH